MSAEAFAAFEHGQPIVETVSPTERAAKVNWLGVRASVLVPPGWPDRLIDKEFELAIADRPSLRIGRVEIVPAGCFQRSAIHVIAALLLKGDGSAFVHDSEIAEFAPNWRLHIERQLFPNEGLSLKIDRGGPPDPDKTTATLQLGRKP